MISKRIGNKLQKHFIAQHETIAVAESVTSGLLQYYFASIINAEKFFQGGITAYNLGQKTKHLNVEPIHAVANNCVSLNVAEQMALHAGQMFNSDWSIGVTGYATPVPASGNRLFCYFTIAYKHSIRAFGEITCKKIAPDKVKEYYCTEIINELIKLLNHD